MSGDADDEVCKGKCWLEHAFRCIPFSTKKLVSFEMPAGPQLLLRALALDDNDNSLFFIYVWM
jgi:hypothetical protein